jgi:hypothetical protein
MVSWKPPCPTTLLFQAERKKEQRKLGIKLEENDFDVIFYFPIIYIYIFPLIIFVIFIQPVTDK